ncbi:MAG: hypothetical protein MH472_02425 [Bacteroidia bacterium]|nr:hypothetical protein [Bacteroidia bacterium]
MKIKLPYFIVAMVFSFVACSRQVNKTSPQTKSEIQINNTLSPVCYYSNYKAAMGSGKGMLFKIDLQTEEPITIDSIIIGGKPMNFTLTKTKFTQLEVNYLVTRPEPNEANPNPKIPADPIIDEQAFNPAYLVLRTNKGIEKLTITQFIKSTN